MQIRLVSENIIEKSWSGDTRHLSDVAWVGSRHNDGTKLTDILKNDLPVNDIPSVVLSITSTIAEREVITSFTDHVMWARTSRVDDPLDFTVDEVFKNTLDVGLIKKQMKRMKQKNLRQDDYRLLLPLSAMTTYMIRISLRSLVKLGLVFSDLSGKMYVDEYCMLFANACVSIDDFSTLIMPPEQYDSMLESYSTPKLFPNISNMESGCVGDVIVATLEAPFSLRTYLS